MWFASQAGSAGNPPPFATYDGGHAAFAPHHGGHAIPIPSFAAHHEPLPDSLKAEPDVSVPQPMYVLLRHS